MLLIHNPSSFTGLRMKPEMYNKVCCIQKRVNSRLVQRLHVLFQQKQVGLAHELIFMNFLPVFALWGEQLRVSVTADVIFVRPKYRIDKMF